MKKITLLVLLFAGSLQAQTYCDISNTYYAIEEITSVNIGSTTISNSEDELIYIDKISSLVNVSQGESFTLTVKGNTNGTFNNQFIAFIDWNHNGILNDEGEVFNVGSIYNSDGYDSKFATISIAVPTTALEGSTRIRILKAYTDLEYGVEINFDPCQVSSIIEEVEITGSYGQVLDFTLNVSTLNRDSFAKDAFLIYPNPTIDVLKIEMNEAIDGISVYNLQGQLVLESDNTKDLNVQSLSSGQYLLMIKSGELSQVKKFVKI